MVKMFFEFLFASFFLCFLGAVFLWLAGHFVTWTSLTETFRSEGFWIYVRTWVVLAVVLTVASIFEELRS